MYSESMSCEGVCVCLFLPLHPGLVKKRQGRNRSVFMLMDTDFSTSEEQFKHKCIFHGQYRTCYDADRPIRSSEVF